MGKSSLLSVYHSLAISHINYSIICWGCSPNLSRIFKLQKRLVRLIYKLGRLESCKDTFLNEKLLTVPSLYIFNCLIYARKHFSRFAKLSNFTRNSNILLYPSHKSSKYQCSPYYMSCKFYNHLPDDVRNIKEFNTFKLAVRNLLLSKCLYRI